MNEDSSVIRKLRDQLKDVKKQLRETDNIEAEVKAEVTRTFQVERQLAAVAQPAGIAGLVEEKLGGVDVTEESVQTALKEIGIVPPTPTADISSREITPPVEDTNPDSLRNVIQNVVEGGDGAGSIDAQIEATENEAELEALMRRTGGYRDHTPSP